MKKIYYFNNNLKGLNKLVSRSSVVTLENHTITIEHKANVSNFNNGTIGIKKVIFLKNLIGIEMRINYLQFVMIGYNSNGCYNALNDENTIFINPQSKEEQKNALEIKEYIESYLLNLIDNETPLKYPKIEQPKKEEIKKESKKSQLKEKLEEQPKEQKSLFTNEELKIMREKEKKRDENIICIIIHCVLFLFFPVVGNIAYYFIKKYLLK